MRPIGIFLAVITVALFVPGCKPEASAAGKLPPPTVIVTIKSVDWSPDGRRLVTYQSDYSTRLWDPTKGVDGDFPQEGLPTAEVWVMERSETDFRPVGFHPDGKHFLARAGDRFALMDIETRKVVSRDPETPKGFRSLYTGEPIYVTQPWKVLEFWDTKAGRVAERVRILPDEPVRPSPHAATVSPDVKLVAFSDNYGVMRVLRIPGGDLEAKWEGNSGDGMRQLLWSPDGKVLFGRASETIRAWESGKGRELWSAKRPQVGALCLAQSSRGLLALGWSDGVVELRDAATGKVEGKLPDVSFRPEALAFSPDGKKLAAGGMRRPERYGSSLFPVPKVYDWVLLVFDVKERKLDRILAYARR